METERPQKDGDGDRDSAARVPVVILGGSDRRASQLPEAGRDQSPLTGYKGVEIRVDGTPLVQTIVNRLAASGAFDPIYIVGPAAVYADAGVTAELIDSDGNFGENIEAAIAAVTARHPGQPFAFTTCDILPEVGQLRGLMRQFGQDRPTDMWFPVVRAPRAGDRLGAFSWKPTYRLRSDSKEDVVEILPGHLALVDPDALRLEFIYRLFQLGYETRNRSITYRRNRMLAGVIGYLLRSDLRLALGLRWPGLTWGVLSAALPAVTKLRAGTITRTQLETALRGVLIRTRHQRRFPKRRIVMPIVDALFLAKDIDTAEEAKEVGGELG